MRRLGPAAIALGCSLTLAVGACAGGDATPTSRPPTLGHASPAAPPTALRTRPPTPALRTAAPTSDEPTPTQPATAPPPATLPPPLAGTPPPGPTSPALPTEPVEPVPVDVALTPALQEVIDDWLVTDGAPGATLGVRLADGRTAVVAAGETDVGTGRAVHPGNRFRAGSITKTFVAALIVGLADEGLLELTDPLVDHLPEARYADRVTIRQLLDHTSGVPDFAAQPAYRTALLRAPARTWRPEDVLELVSSRELDFEPGQGWAYSNTNYVLLGMVAEAATGGDLPELMRRRILEPLGLDSTFLEGLEDSPELAVSGHFDLDGDGTPDNVRAIPYTALVTSGAAAGGISASTLDVLDFATALFNGRLVSNERLAEMMATRPSAINYGAGLARFEPAGLESWGHSGALPGFSTLLVHSPAEGLTIVGMANETGSDVASLVARAVTVAVGE